MSKKVIIPFIVLAVVVAAISLHIIEKHITNWGLF